MTPEEQSEALFKLIGECSALRIEVASLKEELHEFREVVVTQSECQKLRNSGVCIVTDSNVPARD